MAKSLVIVESPTKAKTIQKFLGKEYIVKSSFGHIRDLPKKELAVDVENDFAPTYIIPEKAEKRVKDLKAQLKLVDTVYLATDEDREGEAISWHLLQALKLKDKTIHRIAFHEITKRAILEALENPRELNIDLVDAQQARRVVDRLVGYKLSPFLWKKISYGLSAGRVQSVAVRLVVEKEREIEAFNPIKYWEIKGLFDINKNEIDADLFEYKKVKLNKKNLNSAEEAEAILADLKDKKYKIDNISQRETKKKPSAPFTTSTLQQAANNKLNFSAKQTMMFAQKLYEGIKIGKEGSVGLITYMRTDSLNLSDLFLEEAKEYIKKTFDKTYTIDKPRKFKNKSKGAQEAHEAIRPTSAMRDPESVKEFLEEKQYKLYKLIWQRAIASQMAEMITDSTTVNIVDEDKTATFRAKASVVKFEGYSKVYPIKSTENILPSLDEKDPVKLKNLESSEHETKPPARYSEATLVKVLEEHGIGRPSTYAPTINTIQVRGYIVKDEKRLAPTDIAFVINDLLVGHFEQIVDYAFTAKLEDDFDEIAAGKHVWNEVVGEFYKPFAENLEKKYEEVTKETIIDLCNEVCPDCNAKLIIKKSRFGAFWGCSNYPECNYIRNATGKAGTSEERMEPTETGEKCPECKNPLVMKSGRFGKFIACSDYPECKFTKAVTMGIKCPECKKGELAERKTKTGKIFWSCERYPDCKFSTWNKPYEKIPMCPDCKKGLMVWKKKGLVECMECKHQMEVVEELKDDE